jgi:arylsulfotransferase ASST
VKVRKKLSWALPGLVATLVAGVSASAGATVRVYPSPGSHVASPRTQISLRSVAPSHVGPMEVTGSASGRHTGKLLAHSDGRGASFVPDQPFAPGETVTIRTRLPIYGAHDGDYRIQIATPAAPIPPLPLGPPLLSGSGVQTFHSRHDLIPMRVTVPTLRSGIAPGDVFLGKFNAPLQRGSGQNGPMILDPQGHLVWLQPITAANTLATDVRVQRYQGQPVLTWWQGLINRGTGLHGEGVILDRSYRQIATVNAGNGYSADLHEFLLTPHDTALVLAANPVTFDLSSIHGSRTATVFDNVVQEIDVKTGLVEMEWHSLDQVSPGESYIPPPKIGQHIHDYFHINSVGQLADGSLIVSGRNTWAIYKVDTRTGAVVWRLNGKRSSFHMLRGSTFAWQHDARVQPDGTITLFDDGAAPPVHSQSHGIGIGVDLHHRRAWLRHDWRHSPKILTGSQGNTQMLPNGDAFIGWGAAPFASEFSPHGTLLADYHLANGSESYRAYRFPWDAQPATPPDVAASTDGTTVRVYMSWNGATNVASWDILAGSSPGALSVIGSAQRRDFETAATVRTTLPFVAVQAKDAAGHALGTSAAIRPKVG